MTPTPKHPRAALASLQLGRPVVDFIEERRANGDSWRRVATALRDATDGATDVSDTTVRTWAAAFAVTDQATA